MAEGVETELQRAFLQRHGCRLHQGYLYARLVPAEVFEAMLRQRVVLPVPAAQGCDALIG